MEISLSAQGPTPYYGGARPVVVTEKPSHKFLGAGIAAVAFLALLAVLASNQGPQVSLASITTLARAPIGVHRTPNSAAAEIMPPSAIPVREVRNSQPPVANRKPVAGTSMGQRNEANPILSKFQEGSESGSTLTSEFQKTFKTSAVPFYSLALVAVTGFASIIAAFTLRRSNSIPSVAMMAVFNKIDKEVNEKGVKKGTGKGFKFNKAINRWEKSDDVYYKTTIGTMTGEDYTAWPVIYTSLVEKGLKSITPEAASKQMGKAIFVDVMDASSYSKKHIEGSVNVPLFRPVQGNKPMEIVKKLVMASLAMTATERNPDFRDQAEAALGRKKGQKLIVCCTYGGTLNTTTGPKEFSDPERAFGRESRSLKACYELMELGYKNVEFLEGGIAQWKYEGYPMADL